MKELVNFDCYLVGKFLVSCSTLVSTKVEFWRQRSPWRNISPVEPFHESNVIFVV